MQILSAVVGLVQGVAQTIVLKTYDLVPRLVVGATGFRAHVVCRIVPLRVLVDVVAEMHPEVELVDQRGNIVRMEVSWFYNGKVRVHSLW